MTKEEQQEVIIIWKIKDSCYEVGKNVLYEHIEKIKTDAIDEYMTKLFDHCMQQTNECCKLECPFCTTGCDIVKIAEQLKENK